MGIALTGYFLKLGFVLVLSVRAVRQSARAEMAAVESFQTENSCAAGTMRPDRPARTSSAVARNRRYNYKFWLKACSSTFLSWSSRYLVANALIMAFFAVSDQFLLFARQLVIWIMMLVMPTPGGSGFAEYVFSSYCSDLISVSPAMQLGSGHADRPAVARGNLLPLPRHRRDHLPRAGSEKFMHKQ